MLTTNVTGRVRISCDVRWQAATEPADPRDVGEIDIAAFTKAGLGKEGVDEGAKQKEEAVEQKVTIGKLKDKLSSYLTRQR